MGLWETLTSDWVIWLIPVISALVGWGTNVVAVEMMFHPTEFVGVKPYLGWQGIVPASAMILAKRSTKLITTKLLSLKQLFSGFSGAAMATELGPAQDQLTDQVLEEVAQKHAPEMWASMAPPAQQAIRAVLRKEIESSTTLILDDIHEHIEDIIDLTKIVLDTVAEDKTLISHLFQTVGDQEFKFIKVSGAYFGFLFGLVQMVFWAVYPLWWILPFAGFFVGYATNWLAIKLIFQPADPIKVGPFVVQGLFHKRQQEVAALFSTNIAGRVMNPTNIVRTITTGESRDILFGIVKGRLGELLDKYENNPMTATLMPGDKKAQVREELMQRVEEELPKPGGFLHQFADKAMDIKGELHTRMSALDSKSFEGVLRPAFQQDEWKLILVGAALGLGAGFVQLVTLFGDVWDQVQF